MEVRSIGFLINKYYAFQNSIEPSILYCSGCAYFILDRHRESYNLISEPTIWKYIGTAEITELIMDVCTYSCHFSMIYVCVVFVVVVVVVIYKTTRLMMMTMTSGVRALDDFRPKMMPTIYIARR